MTNLSLMARAALTYVRYFPNWHLFPIRPGTKAPQGRLARRGFLDATCDPRQIEQWWRAEPDSGIGLACASSGLVVIDVDGYKPECEFHELEARLGVLPETPRQLTPQGGVHYLFSDDGVCGFRNPCAGAEAKHEGYVLLAPSVHPNGGAYRWDVGAHVVETEVARLPDEWLRHLTAGSADTTVLPSSGIDAVDSWLGRAFATEGWLGGQMHDGKRMVRCPWLHEHSDGRGDGQDSSTVLFPRAAGRTLGGFRCSHAHCTNRKWTDVIAVLSPGSKWAADQSMREERNRLALKRLAAMRKSA